MQTVPTLQEAADLRHTHNSTQVPAALPAGLAADKQFSKGTQDSKRNTQVHLVPLRTQPLNRGQMHNKVILVCQMFQDLLQMNNCR